MYFRHNGLDEEVKVDGIEFENYKWAGINDLDKILHKVRLWLGSIVQADLKEMAEKGIINK